MILYISGPMTGIPEYNFPAFEAAAVRLRRWGHKVLSPHEAFGGQGKLSRTDYMREDLAMVMRAEGIVLLEEWENSVGARLEALMAQELGLDFFQLGPVDSDVRQIETPIVETIVL